MKTWLSGHGVECNLYKCFAGGLAEGISRVLMSAQERNVNIGLLCFVNLSRNMRQSYKLHLYRYYRAVSFL